MTASQTEPKRIARPEERLILALDVDSVEAARKIVAELDGIVGAFKIGLQLFTAGGPAFVEEIVSKGNRVFLDLKFHDIPNTVAKAGIEAARLGVWMFNVHATGGIEMMRTTVAEVDEFCLSSNRPRPLIIGVTVLTSSGPSTLAETGVDRPVAEQAAALASLARGSGLDGVVASAKELAQVRAATSNEFLIVTPGIRPENATKDDQKRVMTPGSAVSGGADFIVVGRPVLRATDKRAAAEAILTEIAEVS